MILQVARRALAAGAEQVAVATDDERVAAALRGADVRVVMTRADHASGSDRLAECAEQLGWPDDKIVVNLQGDEPLAPPSGIRAVAAALAEGDAPMATLAAAITDARELFNPNCVKVVADGNGNALYFSRAPLPWARDAFAGTRDLLPLATPFLRHIGIYAYRAGFLRKFAALPPTPLERAERSNSCAHSSTVSHRCAARAGAVSGRCRYARGSRARAALLGRRVGLGPPFCS
jgi:3-deoxy-manno-octulosonate cytidylyltransferase (CMP-KDO synthetase)